MPNNDPIDFCNRIPELYIKSDLNNKRTMLRLLIEEILYNHIDTELSVRLKPIFEALRMIKESESANEKVRTLEKPISSEVWEYLEEQVEQLVNSKVRTLKTLIIPNEKDPEGSNSVNGASNGRRHELSYAEFAQQCLHETEIMSRLEKWCA